MLVATVVDRTVTIDRSAQSLGWMRQDGTVRVWDIEMLRMQRDMLKLRAATGPTSTVAKYMPCNVHHSMQHTACGLQPRYSIQHTPCRAACRTASDGTPPHHVVFS